MPIMKCTVCGREFTLSEFQYELMKKTEACCSSECAVKLIVKEDNLVEPRTGAGSLD